MNRMRLAFITAALLALAAAITPLSGGRTALQISASIDSIESVVTRLSLYPSDSSPRTRYCLREAEMTEIADYLADKLSLCTGAPADRIPFEIHWVVDGRDSLFSAENIISEIESSSESSGTVLVTAHYDAVASRSSGWSGQWQTSEAPGADDNATGVAALLEIARALSGTTLPFDLRFILFSGEELSRLGSIAYVEGCDQVCADDILAVINLDMIGYWEITPGFSAITNYHSAWLADLVMSTAGSIDETLERILIKPGSKNWDHGSFWEYGGSRISAISISEPLGENGEILYPYYHTIVDLPERVDMTMVARIANVVTVFLSRFETAQPDPAILEPDILFYLGDDFIYDNVFEVGDTVSAHIRLRNVGGAFGAPCDMSLTVDVENGSGTRTVFSGPAECPEPLRTRTVEIDIVLDDTFRGGNRLAARISSTGDDEDNNGAEAFFAASGGSTILENHFVNPNPVKASFGDAVMCIELTDDAYLSIRIYDIEGAVVFEAGHGQGLSLVTGYNFIRFSDIFTGTDGMAPGIYLYRLRLEALSGKKEVHTGRFAVEY